jgi:CheY-like chemotaxis protein
MHALPQTTSRAYWSEPNQPSIEPYSNLMVVHASKSTARHVLVIDQDLTELERMGQLFSEQGFKVTLSSALLDLDSLEYIDPDVLIVRPRPDGFRAWREYLTNVEIDPRFQDLPVIFVAVRPAHQTAMAKTGIRCIAWPWRPLDLLTLVDSSMIPVPHAGRIGAAHIADHAGTTRRPYEMTGSD